MEMNAIFDINGRLVGWKPDPNEPCHTYPDGSKLRVSQMAALDRCRAAIAALRASAPAPYRMNWSPGFTFAELRRWIVERDREGRIIYAGPKRSVRTGPRVTPKWALRHLLAYLDGQHNDASIVETARRLAA